MRKKQTVAAQVRCYENQIFAINVPLVCTATDSLLQMATDSALHTEDKMFEISLQTTTKREREAKKARRCPGRFTFQHEVPGLKDQGLWEPVADGNQP
mmetsp:Transcript_10118/g.29024  ORF Transcript_10118/g.29024 Transcript_10118/m.29024 type:complete len:98 (-) Transcript_10118:90-383(-)